MGAGEGRGCLGLDVVFIFIFVKVSLKPNSSCLHPNVHALISPGQRWREMCKSLEFSLKRQKQNQVVVFYFLHTCLTSVIQTHDKDYLSLHRFNNGFLYTSAFWLFSSSFFSSSEDPFSFSPVFQLPCLWENKVLWHNKTLLLRAKGSLGGISECTLDMPLKLKSRMSKHELQIHGWLCEERTSPSCDWPRLPGN